LSRIGRCGASPLFRLRPGRRRSDGRQSPSSGGFWLRSHRTSDRAPAPLAPATET
jgi:hypothetical protein